MKNSKEQINNIPYVLDETLINTNLKTGLSSQEATLRLNKFGKNELHKAKKINPFLIYLEQFKDILVIILLFAAIISYALAIVSGTQNNWNWSINGNRLLIEFIEPTIILFVVLTNSLVGAIQEIKSIQAVEALSKLSPLQAKVVRDGNLITLASSDITVGDIVLIESGDVVPSDGYLLFSSNLTVIESALTGESEPATKDYQAKRNLTLAMADRQFMVYSSTVVATGTAYFVVTSVGENNEIGKISKLVNQQKESMTPLQIKINKLGKIFGYSGLALFLASLVTQIVFHAVLRNSFADTMFWGNAIVGAISLAVAAIPEGLIAFTSIILAIGVQRMARKNAIVKNLMAVESLGNCAVICSDKTGTLTQNKMTIVDAFDGSQLLSNNSEIKNFLSIIELGSLCCDANLTRNEKDEYVVVGDPTEIAFLYELEKFSNFKYKNNLEIEYKRLHLFPFDSDRKMKSVINQNDNNYWATVMGAPEIIIEKCNFGSPSIKEKYLQINNQWANNAYRVLAIARKSLKKETIEKFNESSISKLQEHVENDLEIVGLVAMIDPPRESAKDAITLCKQAGIKPVMITGDNLNTAKAIAKNLGIYSDQDRAITGTELSSISDEELVQNIEKYSVYARVKPEDKLRIVNAWQQRKQVVAMTGDGVNDAPALKASDIGCAMGITGTEASKQAANVILADDNFATIVSAVANGRSIYQKIKNVIQSLLITSIAEIILLFIGLFLFKAIFSSAEWKVALGKSDLYIMSATQLLWINLFTHGFPAIALGLQDSKEDYMNRRPISKYESIFANQMGFNTLWKGILIGILSLIAYYLAALYGKNNGFNAEDILKAASTCSFLVLGISATFNSINLMTKKSIFISNPIYYWKVYASVIFSLAFLLIVVFVKNINLVFGCYTEIHSKPELLALGLALPLVIIPIYSIHKLIIYLIEKNKIKENRITEFKMILPPKQVKRNQKNVDL